MKHAELVEMITQVRRSTRNVVMLTICDEAERLSALLNKGGAPDKTGKKRDRKAYMRSYMQKYRKKEK